MAVPLTLVADPNDPGARRTLTVAPGTTILKAAHDGGVDITATCGGRGRCTSCRVKFVAGAIPPPTIGDEVQLGDTLVREGYRLACQCAPTEAVTVQVAPPLEETAFQILGAGTGVAGRVSIASGVDKQLVKVALPREEPVHLLAIAQREQSPGNAGHSHIESGWILFNGYFLFKNPIAYFLRRRSFDLLHGVSHAACPVG